MGCGDLRREIHLTWRIDEVDQVRLVFQLQSNDSIQSSVPPKPPNFLLFVPGARLAPSVGWAFEPKWLPSITGSPTPAPSYPSEPQNPGWPAALASSKSDSGRTAGPTNAPD